MASSPVWPVSSFLAMFITWPLGANLSFGKRGDGVRTVLVASLCVATGARRADRPRRGSRGIGTGHYGGENSRYLMKSTTIRTDINQKASRNHSYELLSGQ